MNEYTQHNASRFTKSEAKQSEQRSNNGSERNDYQLHVQRYTNEQMKAAAQLAGGLHLS